MQGQRQQPQVPGQQQQPGPQGSPQVQPQQGQQVPVVDTDEDYKRLSPGTVFTDKTGKRFKKPG